MVMAMTRVMATMVSSVVYDAISFTQKKVLVLRWHIVVCHLYHCDL